MTVEEEHRLVKTIFIVVIIMMIITADADGKWRFFEIAIGIVSIGVAIVIIFLIFKLFCVIISSLNNLFFNNEKYREKRKREAWIKFNNERIARRIFYKEQNIEKLKNKTPQDKNRKRLDLYPDSYYQ